METNKRVKLNAWGILEFSILFIAGLLCLYNFGRILINEEIDAYSTIDLTGNGLGIAGLIVVLVGLWKPDLLLVKTGIIFLLIAIIINIISIVLSILGNIIYILV